MTLALVIDTQQDWVFRCYLVGEWTSIVVIDDVLKCDTAYIGAHSSQKWPHEPPPYVGESTMTSTTEPQPLHFHGPTARLIFIVAPAQACSA
jgi:hypothetical protein